MKPRKPLIHVELGYNSAKEMHKRGRQFPEAMHIGIDNKGKEGESSSNVDLRRDDFVGGLRKFKPNSIHEINSRLAVGIYDKMGENGGDLGTAEGKRRVKQYTEHVARVAFSRLKPGGQFFIISVKRDASETMEALEKAGFRVSQRRIPKDEVMDTKVSKSQSATH